MTPQTLLITGASGFVGRAIVSRTITLPLIVRAALRAPVQGLPSQVQPVPAPNLGATADWSEAVRGCDVVVHAAARVHHMRDLTADPLEEYRRINVDGTLALAHAAVAAGVRRLVFISSIKVNGEQTSTGIPFASHDHPKPTDPYGVSKLEAEIALRAIADRSGMELVIIRPVLVYGPGVQGNFVTMLRWVSRGLPLPLGAIANRRSIVSVRTLADLVVTAAQHPNAAGRVFLVSDGHDLSTTELLRRIGHAFARESRLVPISPVLLTRLAQLAGKGEMMRRLVGSLQVDIRETERVLGWRPSVSVDDELRATVAWFRDREQGTH